MRQVSYCLFGSALLALACGGTTDSGQLGVAGTGNAGGQTSVGGNGGSGSGTGGIAGVGGTTSVDSRCPAVQPGVGAVCDVPGLTCSYNSVSGCLCTVPTTPYSCVQVNPACVAAQSSGASMPIMMATGGGGMADIALMPSGGSGAFMPPAVGGGAIGVPAPVNHQCTCSNGTWLCTM